MSVMTNLQTILTAHPAPHLAEIRAACLEACLTCSATCTSCADACLAEEGLAHFAECVRANRQPHTPGEEGLQDQRLMEAIYQAAAGGSAVKLPAVQGLDTTRGPAPHMEG